jgi:hypothetical protein
VSCARERLSDFEETLHVLAQVVEVIATVVASDGVVHGLPEALDAVDPGTVDGLEPELELAVFSEEAPDPFGLVDDVVVENEDDSSCSAAVLAA